jgi:hypothetical protein
LQEVIVIRVVISTVIVCWPKIPLGARKASSKVVKARKELSFMMKAIRKKKSSNRCLEKVRRRAHGICRESAAELSNRTQSVCCCTWKMFCVVIRVYVWWSFVLEVGGWRLKATGDREAFPGLPTEIRKL